MSLLMMLPTQMGWSPLEVMRTPDPQCMELLLSTSCGPAAGLAAAAARGDDAAMRGHLDEGAPPDGPPRDRVRSWRWGMRVAA